MGIRTIIFSINNFLLIAAMIIYYIVKRMRKKEDVTRSTAIKVYIILAVSIVVIIGIDYLISII